MKLLEKYIALGQRKLRQAQPPANFRLSHGFGIRILRFKGFTQQS